MNLDVMRQKIEKNEKASSHWESNLGHIEDCEGWWLSGCCGSVAEHRQLKTGVLAWLPAISLSSTFIS